MTLLRKEKRDSDAVRRELLVQGKVEGKQRAFVSASPLGAISRTWRTIFVCSVVTPRGKMCFQPEANKPLKPKSVKGTNPFIA